MTTLRPRLARIAATIAVAAAAVPVGASAYQRPGPASDAAKPYFDVRAGLPATGSKAAPVAPATRSSRRRLVRSLGHDAVLQTDPQTGTVRSLQRLNAPLTSVSSADPRDRAWSYVRSHATALGLDSGDLSAFHLSGRSMTPGGLTSLRWAQTYAGIPAFDNDLRVNVDRFGAIVNVLGAPLHNLTLDSVTPRLGPIQALDALMRNVGVSRNLHVTSGPSGTRRQTRFSSGDFARLVIFGGDGAPRLAWHVTFAASSVANYDAVIDADSGQLLYRQNLTKFASNASVWSNYPGASSGGTAGTVDLTAATTASPTGYLAPAATTLTGPNAHAFSDVNDDDVAQASEEVNHSGGTDFTYPLTDFTGSATDGQCSSSALCSWDGDIVSGAFQNPTSWQTNRQQNAVQAFWFVNNFHDHLASTPIGFTSPDNFQGDDPVLVNADDGAASGSDSGPDTNHLDNANMTTRPVGQPAKMQMYLFAFDPDVPFRDINGGDDAAVVYHEYTHGLSGRLITNADGTEAVGSPEAGAMGEAWSDWYAEDFLVRQGLETDTGTAGEIDLGKYTDATPNTIRSQPLDCPVGASAAACPGGNSGHTGGYTFGDFGFVLGIPEVHADGEIWSETLWDLRSALISLTGTEAAGSDLAEQLITDAMRLSPREPSYLDERNAILGAVDADLAGAEHDNVKDIVWSTFEQRGMGFFAGAADGSDTSPAEDFSAPPAPGGPTGSISGTVTSADTGLPVQGLTVAIGGHNSDPNPSNVFSATTNAAGGYTISGVPTGTYGKVVAYTVNGFDQGNARSVPVTSGGTTARDFAIHRDWAASKGGAQIVDISDDTGADFGCGGDQLIDQSEGVGWSAFNPASSDPENPHAGSPTATIALPQAITVRAFLADPAETCGDGPSAETKGYRIETSPNGVTWTVASQGNFAPADAHRLNSLTPTAGTTNVRYVRLTMLSPQNSLPGNSGADFIDFTELEVLGGPPNVPPSGTVTATPSSVAPGGTVHFDASSFHDPDSLITGYSWDFDGNGTVDSTTSGASADFTYPAAGIFAARVTANDFAGGGGSASATVVVKGPPGPKAPSAKIASSGRHGRVTITITCAASCRVTGRGTITKVLKRRYHLRSRTVAKLSARLTKAGRKKLTLRIKSKVRSALRHRHVKRITVSIRVVIKDANGKRVTRTHRAKVRL